MITSLSPVLLLLLYPLALPVLFYQHLSMHQRALHCRMGTLYYILAYSFLKLFKPFMAYSFSLFYFIPVIGSTCTATKCIFSMHSSFFYVSNRAYNFPLRANNAIVP